MKIVPANSETIARAVRSLRSGELVGIPTETVYGIAARAADEAAVRSIFALKNRPPNHPLIVHVTDLQMAKGVCAEIPPVARRLVQEFWPGPLSLILPKAGAIPPVVTGGLDTVAVRAPGHRIAHALIDALGEAVCAPSANTFTHLSPTRPSHIQPEILAGLRLVLDGGPCASGIESTVLDCTFDPPRILRLGALPRARIEAFLNMPIAIAPPGAGRSPGQHPRHYAPRAEIRIVPGVDAAMPGLVFGAPENARQMSMPTEPSGYAERLYDELHRLDALGVEVVEVQAPPEAPEWEAVWDRLRRAAYKPRES